MKKLFFILMMTMASTAFAWTFATGTYELEGINPDGYNTYRGRLVIEPQGQNYKLTWLIGSRQAQVGIAIYNEWENILSVSFTDLNGTWGVASFKVDVFGDLEGTWATSDGKYQGVERLTWISSYALY